MRTRFYALATVLLALAIMGPADECFDYAEDQAAQSSVDMTKSADPAIQAAGASSDAVERNKEAETNEDEALSPENVARGSALQLGAIDQAISLRPGRASLRMEKAALLIAAGRTNEASVASGEGLNLVVRIYGEEPSMTVYRHEYVSALVKVLLAAPPTSDARKRVEAEMCRNYSTSLDADLKVHFPSCP